MKALIPAAGLGSRFLPATKAQPKEMLLVVDRPVIQYVVEEGLASAADEVIIINSHDKKSIEEHFTPNPALEAELRSRGKDKYADKVAHAGNLNVSYVYQDEPVGLGHAVHCAAVLPVAKEEVDRFGVIAGEALSDDVWKVSSLVEKPAVEEAPSNLAVFGRYLLSPRVMELLAEVKPGAGGEIQLTDALDAVLKEEEMYALVIDPEDGYDTGTIESWLDTNNRLYKKLHG